MAQAISKKERTQTAVEWLNENNITVCEMLLINKISETQYEQLINCFSMNLEQAKAMWKEQIMKAYYDGTDIRYTPEQYYKENYENL